MLPPLHGRADYTTANQHAKALLTTIDNHKNRNEYFKQVLGILRVLKEMVDAGESPWDIFSQQLEDQSAFLREAVSLPCFKEHARTSSAAQDETTSATIHSGSPARGLIPAPAKASKSRWGTTRKESVPAAMSAPKGNDKKEWSCSFCGDRGHKRTGCMSLSKLGTIVTQAAWSSLKLKAPMHAEPDDVLDGPDFDVRLPKRVQHVLVHKVYLVGDDRFAVLITGLNLGGQVITDLQRVFRCNSVVELILGKEKRFVLEENRRS